MDADDVSPFGDTLAELSKFAKPLGSAAFPSTSTIRNFQTSFVTGTASYLGGEIPTVAPQVIGPKWPDTYGRFKPIALTPQYLQQLGLKVKPRIRDRIFGLDIPGNAQAKDKDDDQEDGEDGEDGDDGDDGDDGENNTGANPDADSELKYQHHGSTVSMPFAELTSTMFDDYEEVDPLSVSMRNAADRSDLHNLQSGKRTKEEKRLRNKAEKDRKGTAMKDKNVTHLDYEKAPLSDIYQIFQVLAEKGLQLQVEDDDENGDARPLRDACDLIGTSAIRIFTMCSGTEAPILAMDLVKEALAQQEVTFNFEHVASAEIEPFKQGYIELNFHPEKLFRDVTEFNRQIATTAYGARVAVPGQIHIVVAGSACVDYSSLNAHTKVFGAVGESYATMMGVINYCQYHQPAMVILENIKGAPWAKILAKWHNEVGYDVIAVHVDTKNYMVPQTRQRGYMLGINRKLARDVGFNTEAALERWIRYFGQLQQRASSSYTDFIYRNDSSQNELVRFLVESTASAPSKEISWSLCAHRYMRLRAKNHYGTLRPYTYWQDSGTTRLPDYVWQAWLKLQRARVLDTLDIAHLRYIVDRDYDMSAKSRTVDLSQNIDRDLDSKQWGIVGCLTSTGLLFDTYRGGVVSGIEALILQGIPVDDLILSKLGMKHMIDLAGNAMTSTVIGSAMVAAIATGVHDGISVFSPYLTIHSTIETDISTEERNYPYAPHSSADCKSLFKGMGFQSRKQFLVPDCITSLKVLKSQAYLSRQLCACEGMKAQKKARFVGCRQCAHTACVDCGVNPTHDYAPANVSRRGDPLYFIDLIQNALPRSLSLSEDNDFDELREEFDSRAPFKDLVPFQMQEDLSKPSVETFQGHGTFASNLSKTEGSSLASQDLQELNVEYRRLVLDALRKPFHFRGIKRDTSWKVEFSSTAAKLVLFFRPNGHNTVYSRPSVPIECYWLLNVSCPPNVPQGGLLREKLGHPVARMFPDDSLLTGIWEFWDFDSSNETTATVIQSGQLVPSMEAKAGIVDSTFRSLQVSERLRVEFDSTPEHLPMSGACDFIYLSHCGTPSSLLYCSERALLEDVQDKSAFGRHVYLFLDPGHLQDAIYDSMVIAYGLERIPRTDTRLTLAKFATGWRPVSDARESKQGVLRSRVRCLQTGSWLPMPSARLSPEASETSVSVWTRPSFEKELEFWSACDAGSVIAYSVQLPAVPELLSSFGPGPKKIELDLADKRGKLKPLGFILGRLDVPKALANGHTIEKADSLLKLCEKCAPTQPALVWKWVRGRADNKKLQLRPMDDPDKSRDYERALKSRPLVATADLHVFEDSACLTLSINIPTLLHRTVASLMRFAVSSSQPKVTWRIEKYSALKSASPYIIPRATGNDKRTPLAKTEGFNRKLWITQQRTLGWMVETEANGSPWFEKTVRENPIKPMNWNLIAEASQEVKVRGGIIADGVGTGKSTVVLALVANGPLPGKETSKKPSLIRKDSKATMILIPINLMGQWKDQIVNCFSSEFAQNNLVSIESLSDLMKTDLDELANATIVLVAISIFEDVRYWQQLRDLCYAPNIPTLSGRAYIQWLQAAMSSLSKLSKASEQFGNEEALHACREQLLRGLENDHEFANLSGFRKRDMANVDPDKLYAPRPVDEDDPDVHIYPHAADEDNAARFDVDFDGNPPPENNAGELLALLHMFAWERLIIDEYQYLSPKTYAAVLMLNRGSTWMMSGTPPINDVDSVDAMARLLGTRITMRANEFVGQGFVPQSAKAMLKERSYVEEFQAFNEVDSVAVADLQNRQARAFLTQFMKQNAQSTRDLIMAPYMVPVRPQAVELAVFLLYYIGLNNDNIKYSEKDFELKSLSEIKETITPKSVGVVADTTDAIVRNFAQSRNAHMALTTCYATCLRGFSGKDEETTLKSLYETFRKEFQSYLDLIFERIRESVGYYKEGEGKEGEGKDGMQLENSDLTDWIDETIKQGDLGDRDLTLLIDQMFGHAQEDPKNPEDLMIELMLEKPAAKNARKGKEKVNESKYDRDDKSIRVRNKEMQVRIANLREITKKVLQTMRSLRLLYVLGSIDSGCQISCDSCGAESEGSGSFPVQDMSEDNKITPRYDNFEILATCGHVVCKRCSEASKRRDDWSGNCLADGCRMFRESHNVFDAAIFAPDITSPPSRNCSRANAILDEVKRILGPDATKPADDADYIVIFVQFFAQAKELLAAFKNEGISLTNACVDPGMSQPAKRAKAQKEACLNIEAFKKQGMEGNVEEGIGFWEDVDVRRGVTGASSSGCANSHVLMMMLDSEDAAGWNLQVANHVFLASPYVAPDSFRYKSIIKQSVGRALRVGQPKVVHAYQFAMAYTCEMHALEERRKKMSGVKKALKHDGSNWVWVPAEEVETEESVSGPALLVGTGEEKPAVVREGEEDKLV